MADVTFRPIAGFRHAATCPKVETAVESSMPLCVCEDGALAVEVKAFRRLRAELGLSVAAAATHLGLNSDQLHGWETGWSTVPRETAIEFITRLKEERWQTTRRATAGGRPAGSRATRK